MPVYSMTGYASAQQSQTPISQDEEKSSRAGARLGLEIRSVNSRFLDLTLRLPDELRASEPALRDLLVKQLRRGKVELRASIENHAPGQLVEPSARLLQRLNSVSNHVTSWLPQATALSVADVLRLADSASTPEVNWQVGLLALTQQVLSGLLAARAQEGARLARMLLERIAQLRELAARAEPLIPQLVAQQQQRFLARWSEAMGLLDQAALPAAAQERALTEAVAFAIRIDVAEELTRLLSHLDELERLIKSGGEIGKRLDFLIQELHREANTLGSKSALLELTHISIDMKVLIEQLREQVQNIE